MPEVEHGKGIISKNSSDVLDLEERINKNDATKEPGGQSSHDERPGQDSRFSSEGNGDGQPVRETSPRAEDEQHNREIMETPQFDSNGAESTGADRKRKKAVKTRRAPDKSKGRDGARQKQAGRANGGDIESEEGILSKLVKELQFGSLQNAIALLRQLNRRSPDDPDYRALLDRALGLRDSDVWYGYQRRIKDQSNEKLKERSEKEIEIIKTVSNSNVNNLKRESWFLMRSRQERQPGQ